MESDRSPVSNPVVQAVFRVIVAAIVALALAFMAYQTLPRQARCVLHHPACEHRD